MMEFFRKMQNSWFSKSVLILTALSFVSLFGVSGYIGSAGKNKPVIKVDNFTVSQSEVANQYEQELQLAKSLFGENMEINDNIRNAMLQGIVQKELTNTIIKKTAEDYNIHISDELVRKIIFSQADFMDANGNFNKDKFKRVLSASGWNEQRYIDAIKLDMSKQILVQNPIDNINIPKIMEDKLAKIAKQKKIFKYIKINPEQLKIDRKMSNEELEQYYQDFNAQFIEGETRDVDFIVLSPADIAAKIVPSQTEINAYYQENIEQFETPETREVMQMVFATQDDADKAAAELKAGKDFYAVANDLAKQDKKATDLGYVSKDMLIADMADEIFSASKGQVAGPVKSEMGWHIMKVANIKNGSKTSIDMAKNQIIETIKKEKAYDEAYNISSNIEDKIGSGQSLEDIAEQMKVSILNVKGLREDGEAKGSPSTYNNIIKSNEFLDTAFSYNTNELSQVIETDEGFLVLKVVKIVEAHPKDIKDVKSEIEKIWAVNEKNAISQEIINDVMHDVETGDKIDEIAARFKLNLNTTKELKRSESFEGIAPQLMEELFQEPIDSAKLIDNDGIKIIAVNTQIINNNQITASDIEAVKRNTRLDLTTDFANQMVDSYGSDYDVRVKYRLLGLSE